MPEVGITSLPRGWKVKFANKCMIQQKWSGGNVMREEGCLIFCFFVFFETDFLKLFSFFFSFFSVCVFFVVVVVVVVERLITMVMVKTHNLSSISLFCQTTNLDPIQKTKRDRTKSNHRVRKYTCKID